MNIKKFDEYKEKDDNLENFVGLLTELTNKYGIVIKSTDNIFLMNYNGELGKIEYNYGKKKYNLK
ncbi:MAG: hypothetical protein WDA02_06200 [Saccharofermentanales bacterium]|jgi:hypothetical protein